MQTQPQPTRTDSDQDSLPRATPRLASAPVGALPTGPRRAPIWAAAGLSATTWAVFIAVAAVISGRGTGADLEGVGRLVFAGTVVLGFIFVTMALAHRWLAGPTAQPLTLPGLIVAAGAAQSLVAATVARSASLPGLWSLAARVLEFAAVAVAVTAVARDFNRRAGSTRALLLDSKVAACTDGALRRARKAVETGHRHDIRSALFVVDGAARTLVGRYEDLSPENRQAMADMMADGLGRLTALVDLRLEDIVEVPVGIVVKGVIHAEQQAGFTTRNQIPAGMVVTGRAADLAAVLRTLTAAVRSSVPAGTPVHIRGEMRHDGAVIFVDAGGDDLSQAGAWQRLSTDSLSPGASAGGAALDLYVASRLVDDQGGDLWARGPHSYALRLPVPIEEG